MTIIKRWRNWIGAKRSKKEVGLWNKDFFCREKSECSEKNAGVRNLQPIHITTQQNLNGSVSVVSQLLFFFCQSWFLLRASDLLWTFTLRELGSICWWIVQVLDWTHITHYYYNNRCYYTSTTATTILHHSLASL